METYRSPLTQEELRELQESCKLHAKKEGSAVLQYLDLPWASQNLLAFSKQGEVVKFYQGDKFLGILCFAVGCEWWTRQTILSEVCVLSCKGVHGVQRYAIKALDELAKEFHATILTSGCFFQKMPQAVTNGYLKGGYRLSCPTYIKVVNEHDNQ